MLPFYFHFLSFLSNKIWKRRENRVTSIKSAENKWRLGYLICHSFRDCARIGTREFSLCLSLFSSPPTFSIIPSPVSFYTFFRGLFFFFFLKSFLPSTWMPSFVSFFGGGRKGFVSCVDPQRIDKPNRRKWLFVIPVRKLFGVLFNSISFSIKEIRRKDNPITCLFCRLFFFVFFFFYSPTPK